MNAHFAGWPFQAMEDLYPLQLSLLRDEPKPQHSYIGLIAMAILESREQRLVLSDIYAWILARYPYFRLKGAGWRNSVRHNLSLNDCFVKTSRAPNGKGHFWTVHPANVEDFRLGDFRRRRAQRKVRRHMGLGGEEEEDEDSPSSTGSEPHQATNPLPHLPHLVAYHKDTEQWVQVSGLGEKPAGASGTLKRRFDVESLLAPDPKPIAYHRPWEACV